MTDTKFTPGPWVVSGVSMTTGNVSVSMREHRIVIAEVTNAASFVDMLLGAMKRGGGSFDAGDCHTQHANAQLIAAAPELYEALERLVREFEGQFVDVAYTQRDVRPEVFGLADKALAKARGEA